MKTNLKSGVITRFRARGYPKTAPYGNGRSDSYFGTLKNDMSGDRTYKELCKTLSRSKLKVQRMGRGVRVNASNSYISCKDPNCKYFDIYVRKMDDYEYQEREDYRNLKNFAQDNGYSVTELKEQLNDYGLEIQPAK
jgi:hypothetical protein